MAAEPEQIAIRVLSSLQDIKSEDWNQFAGMANDNTSINALEYSYNPFISYEYLSALELSVSAAPETGWLPQHLVLERGSTGICGVAPCYLKSHSQGEYVFDHGWADAFERAGGRYYPKLQCTVPFTPATSRRLLVLDDAEARKNRLLLAGGLQQLCNEHNASSAHITFMQEDEWQLLGENDYLLRTDQQFHWQNQDFENFEGFLATLASRKRKAIRKERKAALADNGISIEWLTGSDLTEAVWDNFFAFYTDTGARKWGQPYLTREFYSLIGETMPNDIVLIMAKRQGRYVAGAINFIGAHTLFGRHWGAIENHPFLHFEICYYQAIEWAIAHKKLSVEAGAQGPHKLARGYLPKITHSAHYIPNPGFRQAVAHYLEGERQAVEEESQFIATHSPFKKS